MRSDGALLCSHLQSSIFNLEYWYSKEPISCISWFQNISLKFKTKDPTPMSNYFVVHEGIFHGLFSTLHRFLRIRRYVMCVTQYG